MDDGALLRDNDAEPSVSDDEVVAEIHSDMQSVGLL